MATIENPVWRPPHDVPLIVLCGGLDEDFGINERSRARADVAYDGLISGDTPHVVIAGGSRHADDSTPSESGVVRGYLRSRFLADPAMGGIDWSYIDDRITLDDASSNTRSNLEHAAHILCRRGLERRVGMVTDPLHMGRAKRIASQALSSQTSIVPVLAAYTPRAIDVAWELGGYTKMGIAKLKNLRHR